jgi:riboflavin synthase
MFTGIIAAIGTIQQVHPAEDGVQIDVLSHTLDLSDVKIGDSIALNGACMTVISKTDQVFAVDVSGESLRCTVGLNQEGKQLNLEKALRFGDRLGGHLVSGHVDGLGQVLQFDSVGESYQLMIQAPQTLAKYLAVKGSIVVNGVSLTTNWIKDTPTGCEFLINLIPHTLQVTTLKTLRVGEWVNLEVDLLARYIERMLYADKALH